MKALKIAGDSSPSLAHPYPGQVGLEAIQVVLVTADRGRAKAALGTQVPGKPGDRAAERHLMVTAAASPVSGDRQLEHQLHRAAELLGRLLPDRPAAPPANGQDRVRGQHRGGEQAQTGPAVLPGLRTLRPRLAAIADGTDPVAALSRSKIGFSW